MGLSDSKGKGIRVWNDGPKGGERGRPIPQRLQVALLEPLRSVSDEEVLSETLEPY